MIHECEKWKDLIFGGFWSIYPNGSVSNVFGGETDTDPDLRMDDNQFIICPYCGEKL